MNPPRLLLLLLSAGLVTGGGCGRKKDAGSDGAKPPTPVAQQGVAAMEQSPDAALALLNDALTNWLLRHPTYPKDLQEFVAARMLPKLPVPPPGKRFIIDRGQNRVVLADQ